MSATTETATIKDSPLFIRAMVKLWGAYLFLKTTEKIEAYLKESILGLYKQIQTLKV